MELREPSQRVSPKARLMWATVAAVEGLVASVAVAVAGPGSGWLPVPWWAVGLLALASAAYAIVVPQWRYLVHRWEVTETAVDTLAGWWSRVRRIAPKSRIQTIDHAEVASARLFGLSTVTVTTASAAGALEIEGLFSTLALDLVD